MKSTQLLDWYRNVSVTKCSESTDALFVAFLLASFEDKRKENYDKGQAELERRRKALADIQKKEIEERERKVGKFSLSDLEMHH